MEQSSEQLAGCVQSAAGVGVARGRDAGVHGGPVHTRSQGRTLGVLELLSGPLPRPSQSPPDRHPEGRALRRAAHPRRLHVQGRGQRRVLPAVSPPQDGREPQGQGPRRHDQHQRRGRAGRPRRAAVPAAVPTAVPAPPDRAAAAAAAVLLLVVIVLDDGGDGGGDELRAGPGARGARLRARGEAPGREQGRQGARAEQRQGPGLQGPGQRPGARPGEGARQAGVELQGAGAAGGRGGGAAAAGPRAARAARAPGAARTARAARAPGAAGAERLRGRGRRGHNRVPGLAGDEDGQPVPGAAGPRPAALPARLRLRGQPRGDEGLAQPAVRPQRAQRHEPQQQHRWARRGRHARHDTHRQPSPESTSVPAQHRAPGGPLRPAACPASATGESILLFFYRLLYLPLHIYIPILMHEDFKFRSN